MSETDIAEIISMPRKGHKWAGILFDPLPRDSGGCLFCPPGRGDPFVKRVIWRSILLLCIIKWVPKKKWVWLFVAIPLGLIGCICEIIAGVRTMAKEKVKSAGLLLCMVVMIAIPSYIIVKKPTEYGVATQVLFSILLCIASVWFGIFVNTAKARKEATAKWVPAAESACKQLLTISATAERMKRTLVQSCKDIEISLPNMEEKEYAPFKCMVGMQCRETGEKLATLRGHVENAVSHWQVFIGANCEGDECGQIEQRIKECRTKIFADLCGDGCLCEGTGEPRR